MSKIWAPLQDLQQLSLEVRILAGKLEGEGWEDLLEIITVLEIPRTEETGSKLSILEGRLRKRLGNGRFSGPSQTVEPEDTLAPFVCKPMVNILENFLPCSLQTPLSVPAEVASVRGVM